MIAAITAVITILRVFCSIDVYKRQVQQLPFSLYFRCFHHLRYLQPPCGGEEISNRYSTLARTL